MTEEEKKTIEFLEELKNCYKKIVDSNPKGTKHCTMELEHIQTALNLIQKQEAEKQCLKQAGEATEKVYKAALEKKDKIIDEMVKSWKQDDVRSVEEIIQYFEKKVKDFE